MDGRKLRWYLQNMKTEYIRYTIYAVVIVAYLFYQLKYGNLESNSDEILDVFSVTAAFSALSILACEFLARSLSRSIQTAFEDSTKLTEDYKELMKKYNRVKLIEYRQERFPGEAIAFRKWDDKPFQFEFNHAMKWHSYEVPKQIKDRSSDLMKAHDCSKIYNNTNVRLEDCQQSGNIIRLTYSKTMYYDLLITNRVMDYPLEVEKWHTIKSVRQIYEPGPFISPLSQSKLSNHLGFNGFVELADGYVVFVQRSSDVSIGKMVWSPSVNASYKAQYGLNDRREMSARYMGNAIRQEIRDELKISIKENDSLEESVFAFYRDLVEGGKPHFVFYYKMRESIWTREFFEKNFERERQKRKAEQKRRTMSKEDKIKDDMLEDGQYFRFFSIDELKHSVLYPNKLAISDDESLKMQSDGIIALALLLRHLADVEEDMNSALYDWFRKTIRIESDQMPPEMRLSTDEVSKLAETMVKLFFGQTTVEEEADSPNSLFNEEFLRDCLKRAEENFKDVLKDSPQSRK